MRRHNRWKKLRIKQETEAILKVRLFLSLMNLFLNLHPQ